MITFIILYFCIGLIISIINSGPLHEIVNYEQIKNAHKYKNAYLLTKNIYSEFKLAKVVLLIIICLLWPFLLITTIKLFKQYVLAHKSKPYDKETLEWVKNHPQFKCKKKK